MAKIIKLIYTEERTGLGVEGDPVRKCPQLWTLDGKLVASYDFNDVKEMTFNPEGLKE